jgi:hypothetical protein
MLNRWFRYFGVNEGVRSIRVEVQSYDLDKPTIASEDYNEEK